MISFEKALNIILKSSGQTGVENIKVEKSIGRIIAEDVRAAIPMPPFNKAAMDGYAVYSKDVFNMKLPVRLKCIGTVQAGGSFKKNIKPGECVKIMTGAPLPGSTDSVVMVENTASAGDSVSVNKGVKKWENVCFRGEDIKKNQKVVSKNTFLQSSHISLIAAAGRSSLRVQRLPKVSILNTGGEIVQPGRRIAGNKIYNSNGPQLASLLISDGITPDMIGIARDEEQELIEAVRRGFKSDILLISGGVSMGDYDLVPGVLEKLGAEKIFHKVRMKPGKPFFFGKKGKTLVFGLPGNPVSNFLAYQVFIRPAVKKMAGNKDCKPVSKSGILNQAFRHKAGRKHFFPVTIHMKEDTAYLTPVKSHGSADVMGLSLADGFMVIEKDVTEIKAGSGTQFITWKNI